ncbi:DUF2721 domain-containing protein [Methylocapsa polymorpha]|uniref:DUF2721 domain-containing protein n=1 Tax=Methylocapsa polymorpha TaxID=3080828 RepID=A0ABZ0HSZ5_9HYPH|nr:DUF2721 domain-containing protein [Methylocapsa sp. RX1]
MSPVDNPAPALDSVAHIIQVALTPVFLLAVFAQFFNAVSTRIGRVADTTERLAEMMEGAGPDEAARLRRRLACLRRRSLALDAAVALGALGGVSTCAAILALLVGHYRNSPSVTGLLLLFGFAISCILGALVAFAIEIAMAGKGLRSEAARSDRRARR